MGITEKMSFVERTANFLRRNCRAASLTFRYELINSYVTLRWVIFCATGLWGFGELREPPQVDPMVALRRRILSSMAAQRQRTIELQFPQRRSRISGADHSPPGLFRPVPGQVRYLGQFYYPSWDDRRWKPTEKDYEADDEAED